MKKIENINIILVLFFIINVLYLKLKFCQNIFHSIYRYCMFFIRKLLYFLILLIQINKLCSNKFKLYYKFKLYDNNEASLLFFIH